jgi:hypothetical protein
MFALAQVNHLSEKWVAARERASAPARQTWPSLGETRKPGCARAQSLGGCIRRRGLGNSTGKPCHRRANPSSVRNQKTSCLLRAGRGKTESQIQVVRDAAVVDPLRGWLPGREGEPMLTRGGRLRAPSRGSGKLPTAPAILDRTVPDTRDASYSFLPVRNSLYGYESSVSGNLAAMKRWNSGYVGRFRK